MNAYELNRRLPLFAVLRGLEPVRAAEVARILVGAGFEILEVTMNSPDPLSSIAAISAAVGQDVLVGAGTVTSIAEVDSIINAGGKLIVSPHCDPELIAYAAEKDLVVLPGVLTPSEMFSALHVGATGLKVFPAELMPPSGIKALKAVLPANTPVFAVGGIHVGNMAEYLAAGAAGFGIGGSLFKAGKSIAEIERDAKALVAAFHHARNAIV
ncbi:2-dehydro-3-deoxy-6-phosphogalactonate aldolase [Novosphingobium flavum]|uniref:2-dehydro-3-deoxy-6-phosphogalactonate aldolase n=1 Tax=Novosphingobium aerophilum TaxID=2839843 RepID=UPI00163AC90B|nr:2-dehydro-3-deoxy-6-phosphogalactonate aldolase [Novosphingobium aerophilum]MBC2663499.1 2-dehydro-3-deoxy-6-phosphogalactonate aldolase [Novosphingobium aerophilum]